MLLYLQFEILKKLTLEYFKLTNITSQYRKGKIYEL